MWCKLTIFGGTKMNVLVWVYIKDLREIVKRGTPGFELNARTADPGESRFIQVSFPLDQFEIAMRKNGVVKIKKK